MSCAWRVQAAPSQRISASDDPLSLATQRSFGEEAQSPCAPLPLELRISGGGSFTHFPPSHQPTCPSPLVIHALPLASTQASRIPDVTRT